MKNINLPNPFSHTPRWATRALTILTFVYGLNALCVAYDIYNLPVPVLTKINGLYTVCNIILLSFGVKPVKQ